MKICKSINIAVSGFNSEYVISCKDENDCFHNNAGPAVLHLIKSYLEKDFLLLQECSFLLHDKYIDLPRIYFMYNRDGSFKEFDIVFYSNEHWNSTKRICEFFIRENKITYVASNIGMISEEQRYRQLDNVNMDKISAIIEKVLIGLKATDKFISYLESKNYIKNIKMPLASIEELETNFKTDNFIVKQYENL